MAIMKRQLKFRVTTVLHECELELVSVQVIILKTTETLRYTVSVLLWVDGLLTPEKQVGYRV